MSNSHKKTVKLTILSQLSQVTEKTYIAQFQQYSIFETQGIM